MIVARLVLAFTVAFISWQATIQNVIELPPLMNNDKILHYCAFGVLAFLLDYAFPRSRFGFAKIMVLILYGLGIEYVQSFLPYRSASAGDLYADILGICTYAFFIPLLKYLHLYRRYWRR